MIYLISQLKNSMKNLIRDDLYLISRHSNLNEKTAEELLTKKVFSDDTSWKQFLKLLFLTLGVGFSVAGIIFFFAYNWADLNKFAKLGIVELLVIATTGIVLFSKLKLFTKNIILTGASMLVGVLYAVFGQIYQTGANAYDFFLAWTIFIALWVLVSNFAPLWLLFIVLINTTFVLYTNQVAQYWSELNLFSILFVFNASVLIFFTLLSASLQKIVIPDWFLKILSIGVVFFATIAFTIGIDRSLNSEFLVLLAAIILVFGCGLWYGLQKKSTFYLAIIPLSIIIMISALLMQISEGEIMLLTVSMFIIISISLVIKNIINLQKKWKNAS